MQLHVIVKVKVRRRCLLTEYSLHILCNFTLWNLDYYFL